MNEPKKKRGRPPGSKGKVKTEPPGQPAFIKAAINTPDVHEAMMDFAKNNDIKFADPKESYDAPPMGSNIIDEMGKFKPPAKALSAYNPFNNPRFIAKMKIKSDEK